MAAVEHLRVIHLGRDRSVLGVSDYAGGPRAVAAPLRTIIADALRLGSAGLVMSHNHPSGDPTPSADDRALTGRLARAADVLGIRLHDHLIYGGGRCMSFRAMGLL